MNPRSNALGLAERTRKNLAYIEAAFAHGADVHVITQVVNSLLGLLVFPWERHFADYVAHIPLQELEKGGWPLWEITRGYANTLGQLVRCLRNAAAHGHIQFSSDSRHVDEVVIEASDYRPRATEPYWSARIRASELRDFCYKFTELIEGRLG